MSLTSESAVEFLQSTGIIWHQRFELAQGIFTPGANDVGWLLNQCAVPDLQGKAVLDIGANNGGVCFEMERRGAARVVGVDIAPPDYYGFVPIRDYLGSKVEYIQCSVYDLPNVLQERFDVVFFLGVLYHLRHPLLALDSVRSVTGGIVFIETAIADSELGATGSLPVARYYRLDELSNDSSNWFAPTKSCLLDWCWSCGLEPRSVKVWPARSPLRGLVEALPVADDPEYLRLSYERPIRTQMEFNPNGSVT